MSVTAKPESSINLPPGRLPRRYRLVRIVSVETGWASPRFALELFDMLVMDTKGKPIIFKSTYEAFQWVSKHDPTAIITWDGSVY